MLLRLTLIFIGYVVAVAVATAVTVALLFAPSLANGLWAGIRSALADAPPILVVGFFWTFICALPGFVVAVVLGERKQWLRWLGYAFAGLADVIPSFAIFGGLTGSLLGTSDLVLAALPGGAAYWAAAGRLVAARRRGRA